MFLSQHPNHVSYFDHLRLRHREEREVLAYAGSAGYYALGNLLYSPVKGLMVGGEFQWGRRENFSDGWKYDDYKIQFVFKYSFSHKLGG